MKKLLAGVAGAISIVFLASAAQAAPLGGASNAAAPVASSEIIQVHGLHSACRWDSRGWHRSYVWGRKWCAGPRRHRHYGHHHHHHWKKHQHRHWKKKH